MARKLNRRTKAAVTCWNAAFCAPTLSITVFSVTWYFISGIAGHLDPLDTSHFWPVEGATSSDIWECFWACVGILFVGLLGFMVVILPWGLGMDAACKGLHEAEEADKQDDEARSEEETPEKDGELKE